ncbi:MAG: flagellar biosynthetic protein FliR [Defluviitaleaceae bacterium]|nr:flagellar biosynthetic protein FliR [Defluviitaleaceae bacterium]
MDYDGALLFLELFNNVDVFLAVFVRIIGIFVILPVFSGQNIPAPARISLALGLALLAMTSQSVNLPPYHFSIWGFAALLVSEFMVGMIIGFVVMMLFSLFQFVGQLVDHQMGFAMVSVHDPLGQQQAPVSGNLYFFIVTIFFIVTGAMNHIIFILFESFGVIDIGTAEVVGNADLIAQTLNIIVIYFHLGVRIAVPITGTLLAVDIILGILVKAVPQMNVFVVGLPLKVFLGSILLYLTLPMLQPIFANVFNHVVGFIMEMIRGMVPS